jgi:hypothetical protein
MAKSKSKLITKILLIIVCIVSIGGGVFSTVYAVNQSEIYNENIAIVNKYTERYEDDSKAKTIFETIPYYVNEAKQEADDAKILADDAKSQMTKFSVLAGVLYFVALMMLISFIALIKSKKSKKE